MQIGIGLPTGIPNVDGELVLEWARRADEGPFSSLGVVDRVAYDTYEPFTALAAAAAITRRVKLATIIAVGPLRSTALLAKTAASIDALSHGRLVLGIAVGAREEDYSIVGMDYRLRGKHLTEQLSALRTWWKDNSSLGPKSVQEGGPKLLVAGKNERVYQRIVKYADGYVGGTFPATFASAAEKVRATWAEAGRPGKPYLWAHGYFALGDKAVEEGRRYMEAYYAFAGPFAAQMASGMLTSPQAIVQFIHAFKRAGCDELVLLPAVADIVQLEQLAQVLAGLEI